MEAEIKSETLNWLSHPDTPSLLFKQKHGTSRVLEGAILDDVIPRISSPKVTGWAGLLPRVQFFPEEETPPYHDLGALEHFSLGGRRLTELWG